MVGNYKLSIQVLVATMDQTDNFSLPKKMNLINYVVINQSTNSKVRPIDLRYSMQKFISVDDKGLSKSRNTAIKNATSDILVFADDDMKYTTNYENTIRQAYKKLPDADIIAFGITDEDSNKDPKKIPRGKVNFLTSMKINSVRITARSKSLFNNNIAFNEKFGAGSAHYMGEENIMLAEALKKKLKIYYDPSIIGTLQNSESSWFSGYNLRYFEVKGRVFYKMSPLMCQLLIVQFALRKRSLYSATISASSAIKLMRSGANKQKTED